VVSAPYGTDILADDGKNTDHELIEAACLQKQGAGETFVYLSSCLVYFFCSSVFSPPELEYLNVFRHLKSNNFPVLRAFDGPAPFSSFTTNSYRRS
jgi:hypothetical protein